MRVIVSVGVGGRYPEMIDRLNQSLIDKHFLDKKHLLKYYPKDCPTHQQMPYAFKPHAIKEVAEEGATSILWVDSAVWANKDIERVFDIIERDGYLLLRNGWTQANWSSDRQLDFFGVTRDQAQSMTHPMACIVGFSMVSNKGYRLFKEYFDAIPSFDGAWTNDYKQCSEDARCMGSRHDQTALGFIAAKHGLKFTDAEKICDYQCNNDAIFYSRGM